MTSGYKVLRKLALVDEFMDLWSGRTSKRSAPGIFLACVTNMVTPLSRAERKIGRALGSAVKLPGARISPKPCPGNAWWKKADVLDAVASVRGAEGVKNATVE